MKLYVEPGDYLSEDEHETISGVTSDFSTKIVVGHFSDSTDLKQTSLPEQKINSKDKNQSYQNQFILNQEQKAEMDTTPLLGHTQIEENQKGYIILLGDDHKDPEKKWSISSAVNNINPFEGKGVEQDNKHGSIVTIFTVWNTIMGSSLLTMAWGIERAGLIPGITLMIIMGTLCLFTSYTILSVNKNHGTSPQCEISELCNILLGRSWKIISDIFGFMVMIGANIVYWVLMTSFLYYSVLSLIAYLSKSSSKTNPAPISINSYEGLICASDKNYSGLVEHNDADASIGPFWDLHSTVPIYVSLIIFPLISIKDDRFFKKFTSLGTLSVLYLMIFIIIKGAGWGIHVDSWGSVLSLKTNFTALSGMLALSFYIHNIIITVMGTNRHPEKNERDLSIAFVLVIATYVLAGSVFYMCFPLPKSCIEDNILNNFVMSDPLTAMARILLLFQIVTVYPLIAYMLRMQVLNAISDARRKVDSHILLFNLALMTVCILFACFVPKIGTIIRYTGALSGMVHIFTLPSLLQITSLRKRGKLTIIKGVFYASIFIIGFCNLVAQFFVGD